MNSFSFIFEYFICLGLQDKQFNRGIRWAQTKSYPSFIHRYIRAIGIYYSMTYCMSKMIHLISFTAILVPLRE